MKGNEDFFGQKLPKIIQKLWRWIKYIDFLIEHLYKTFKSNYGYEWNGVEPVHIDHIIPLATANTEEEVIALCHYTNLQLLKAQDNLSKNKSLDWTLSK